MVSLLPTWKDEAYPAHKWVISLFDGTSCIVQSFTNAAQKHQKARVAPWPTNSARCFHLPTFLWPIRSIICHEHVAVSWRWSWTMYCFAAYHCLVLRACQAMLGYSLPKTLSPGVAWGIYGNQLMLGSTHDSSQATGTALLSCPNVACGFRIAAPADWEIQRHLWGAFGICTAQLTFQERGAWSCNHKSCKSARACKCNLHCCWLPAKNSLVHLHLILLSCDCGWRMRAR